MTENFCSVTSTTDAFGNCLMMNFQWEELLLLKKSLDNIMPPSERGRDGKQPIAATKANATNGNEECCGPMQPQRMALMANGRGDHSSPAWQQVQHHSPWQTAEIEEKPSKLQTLFHISITALSFLSFGGYLLCLIVQGIKSKGTTYFHPVATSTTTTNGSVKRIKVYRRSRRHTGKAVSVF